MEHLKACDDAFDAIERSFNDGHRLKSRRGFVTSKELDEATQFGNGNGQNMRPLLEALEDYCEQEEMPYIGVMVVDKKSYDNGDLLPSSAAMKDGYGPRKLDVQGVKRVQREVLQYLTNRSH